MNNIKNAKEKFNFYYFHIIIANPLVCFYVYLHSKQCIEYNNDFLHINFH